MCLAIPGRVISISGNGIEREGIVSFGGIERSVNLGFTPEAGSGDFVIVHVGCAIKVLDEEEAQRVLALLSDMASLEAGHAVS